ncbi:restriction endonuclease subunit S [Staphylococcus pseudintermedius]|nr:restriction endonuclease subunit S [Staphylococcus pseudintermedius]
MTSEVKNVPELRFSQFDKEWKKTTIADIGEFYYGRSAPKWSITDDATIPCVRYGELYTKHKGTVKEIYSYTNIDRNKLRFSKGGEILIPRVGEDPMDFAKCSYLPFSGVAIGEMISVYNTDQNPVFITAYFNSQMKYEFAKRVEGASVSNLYYSYLKDINLRIPTIEEQQKIGDFFSKLDRQIELEEEKLELLEQQKRGYMQKIFSQELRFKDKNGNEYPEWQLKKLSELGETFTGLSGKTKDDFGYGDGLFITYMNVFKNTIAKSDMVERVKIEANENQNKVQYGDILFTTSSEVPNEVGMSSIWLFNQDNVYLNSFCFGFRVVVNYIKPVYLARYLRSEEMRKTITILAQGSTRFNISKKEMIKLNIKVPYIEEQIKIDNFFNKIDTLVLKQGQKIELLKQRKQGLLQKMFI